MSAPVASNSVPRASLASAETRPLRVEQLRKTFRQGERDVVALENVSLEARRGEFVAIMGASGSGKSTLLNLLAGITHPDSGRVLIDDVELTALKDPHLTLFRRQKIGLVFQAFNLIPTLTAEENILLPVLAGSSQGPLSAQELLERVNLSARRQHRPDALSGGEQQRIAIARALISNPAILLADEPTGSLDSVTGENICRLLKDLQAEQQRTIVVVTHEPEVAMWADRVIVLKDGRLLTEFSTSDFSDAQALANHYHEAVHATDAGAVR